MTLWYGTVTGASNVHYQQGYRLLHGDREELKVTPQQRPVKVLGPGGTVLSRTLSNIIVLHFGGNWVPITGELNSKVHYHSWTFFAGLQQSVVLLKDQRLDNLFRSNILVVCCFDVFPVRQYPLAKAGSSLFEKPEALSNLYVEKGMAATP